MGPGDPRPRARGAVPYAVKVHGSALEYTVKPQPERFLASGPRGARAAPTASWSAHATPPRACGGRSGEPAPAASDPSRARRGSTSSVSRPREPEPAAPPASGRWPPGSRRSRRPRAAAGGVPSAFDRDAVGGRGGARANRPRARPAGRIRRQADRQQGRRPAAGGVAAGARSGSRGRGCVVVGFGAYREGLERLAGALAAGDLERAPADRARPGATLERRAGAAGRGRCAICSRSSTASTGRASRERYLRPPRRAGRAGRADAAASITRSSPSCCPRARRWSSPAPSPRPSAWSPRRRRPAARCRSARRTRASRR